MTKHHSGLGATFRCPSAPKAVVLHCYHGPVPPVLQARGIVLVVWAIIVALTGRIVGVDGFSSASQPASSSSSSSSTVIYDPTSREILLLVAKLAAREGIETSCICSPGKEDACRNLMYGPEYAEVGVDEPNRAKPISGAEDMERALSRTTSLVLIGNEMPVDPGTVETFIKYTSDDCLRKIVLLSKMGVTTQGGGGGGGFFGMGGGGKGDNAAFLDSEKTLANIADDRGLDFCIVRCGVLKGGGPGENVDDGTPRDLGLSSTYYNRLLDIIDAKVTIAHDKFTLGAEAATSVFAGDVHQMPNKITQLGTKSSFDPRPTDTNRIVLAGAVVATLLLSDDAGGTKIPADFSVGSAKGESPPTVQEWHQLLQSLVV